MGMYPPGPGFPVHNSEQNHYNMGHHMQQPIAATGEGWNNYLNTNRQQQGFDQHPPPPATHQPQMGFIPVFPSEPQASPYGYPSPEQHYFHQPISSSPFTSTVQANEYNEYTAGEDFDFHELRLLNLKRNLYGYNNSYSNR